MFGCLFVFSLVFKYSTLEGLQVNFLKQGWADQTWLYL